VYFILGGNRQGSFRRYFNLILTMLIGGFWHGAGWGFIFWGGVHGIYLIVNHAYLKFYKKYNAFKLPYFLCVFITVVSVTVAWVFFRAETLSGAFLMLESMFYIQENLIVQTWSIAEFIFVFIGLLIILALPNTLQFFKYKGREGFDHETDFFSFGKLKFSFTTARFAIIVGCCLAISLMFMPKQTVFIYFNF